MISEADNQDQRKDEDFEQRGDTSLQMRLEEMDDNDSEKKCCLRCWIPELKTVGRCHSV